MCKSGINIKKTHSQHLKQFEKSRKDRNQSLKQEEKRDKITTTRISDIGQKDVIVNPTTIQKSNKTM